MHWVGMGFLIDAAGDMTSKMESVMMLGPGVDVSLTDSSSVLRIDGSLSLIAIVPGIDWHLCAFVSR